MNEERENGRFDPADFIPADAQPKVAVSCELEEPPRGSALTGILGALFGALVGAVPWFLTSTFADFFVGWLGFLVGVAACWGYRLFKGRRSTRFAMATVIVCSLLALFAAEIASWMYVLCSDPEWQADAAWSRSWRGNPFSCRRTGASWHRPCSWAWSSACWAWCA